MGVSHWTLMRKRACKVERKIQQGGGKSQRFPGTDALDDTFGSGRSFRAKVLAPTLGDKQVAARLLEVDRKTLSHDQAL